MTERVLRQDQDGCCTLLLNRPDKLNALDNSTFEELKAHIDALSQDDGAIGCVILRGAGKGFCAGADLAAMASGATPLPPTFKPAVIESLAALPMPTVAAVHGVCFTGGLELALGCDFIIADARARFADTHGKWGLVAAWGLYQRLSRRVGTATTKRMSMTAAEVGAEEALRIGLADLVALEDGLDALVADFAARLAANSAFSNRAVKKILADTDGMSLAQGLAHDHYRHPGVAPDFRERVAAFTKR